MKKTLKIVLTVICFAAIGFSYLKYTDDNERKAKDFKLHECEVQAIRRAAAQFELLRYAIDSDYMDQYEAASTFYWIRTEQQTRMQTCGEQ